MEENGDLSTSRPARGAWIETDSTWRKTATSRRRAPHGARGLKLPEVQEQRLFACRAPHGARGLKLKLNNWEVVVKLSRPARGAWIETRMRWEETLYILVAPRTGRVD